MLKESVRSKMTRWGISTKESGPTTHPTVVGRRSGRTAAITLGILSTVGSMVKVNIHFRMEVFMKVHFATTTWMDKEGCNMALLEGSIKVIGSKDVWKVTVVIGGRTAHLTKESTATT